MADLHSAATRGAPPRRLYPALPEVLNAANLLRLSQLTE